MGGVASGPMVGRDRELARVTLMLDDALAGGGRLVLCTGEAGIGKTRLAEEAAASAAAKGVPVAWARAADRDSLPPYGLWQLVLAEPAVRAADDDPSRADLWSRVFGDAERPALADGADSGSAQRFALFAEVRRRLALAASRGGLVLVLDDLQWADEASAVLLADVVRQLRGTPILVLATYRESAASGEVSAGLLSRLSADANTERVNLHGLPAGAVGEMLHAAGLPTSPDQVGEVHSETGGNPFLVRELARMLAEQRRGGPVPVPGRVVEATAYRLAQLSDPARALVQSAAVAGNSFSAGVVAQMLDAPVLTLLGPLDECLGAGFLVAGDRPGDHRFSHALVRSAVAARLSAAEQRRLHTAAADAIEALYQGQLDLHLAELARHRVEASLPGDRTRAVAACEAAADVAAQSLAFEEAVRLYRQALSVGEGEIGDPGRSRLELALAAAQHRSGDLPGAQQTAAGVAERAVLASRLLEAADAAGSAWLEMWGRLWQIDTLFETGQLRSVRPELADLESCLERVPGPLGQWHFLETSATLALATGRFTEAKRLAADAFKTLSDTGHPMAFGGCAVILGQAGLHIGFGRSGFVELFDQIPAHLRPDAVDTTRGIATVFPALSFALIRLHQGDRAAAEAAYAQAGPVRSWTPVPAMSLAAWAHGLPVAIGLSRTQDIEFLAARFEPFRGQHVANGAGPGVYMGPVELPLGQAAAALGRLEEAVEDLRSATSICDANGARGYAVQARVELAAALTRRQAPGDQDEALAALDAAAAEAEQLGMVPFTEWIEQLRVRRPAAAAGGSPLSPRELEVARLVGRGLTNKQIGQNLYVSERTAENHVQHILTKLGLRNRSQIAAWATGEHGASRH